VLHDLTRRDALRLSLIAGLGAAGIGCSTTEADRRREAFKNREPLPDPHQPMAPSPTYADRYPAPTSDPWLGRVIPRSAWTNEPPITRLADPMRGISRITVHHDGMSPFYATDQASAAHRIELIRRSHLGRGWADIGYHYVIDPAGRIYSARPLALQGAHVKYNNEHNLGVMVLGNYERQQPTGATKRTLAAFVGSRMELYKVPTGRVFTHQEIRPTACPGRSLQGFMVQTRRRGGALA